MVVLTPEEMSVGDSAHKGVDVFKVVTWIAAAALPWAVLIVAARLLIAAFT